jgi:hypothetical protein
MGKLNLDSTIESAVLSMSEGNPGAIHVLMESARTNEKIDPDNFAGPWGLMVNLDALEIYGERIWMLYKDLCGESVPKTTAVARACQLGILPRDQLDRAIDEKAPLDVNEIVGRVRDQLPNFLA